LPAHFDDRHRYMKRDCLASLGLWATLLGCGSRVDHFVVTTRPLDVAVIATAICIGVDTDDRFGIWWWEPGATGCGTRSTGPGLFHADHASVVALPSGAIECRFSLQIQAPPGAGGAAWADVALQLQNGRLRSAASGDEVPTERRNHLDIPRAREEGPRVRRMQLIDAIGTLYATRLAGAPMRRAGGSEEAW
jgi:hypothetical protein